MALKNLSVGPNGVEKISVGTNDLKALIRWVKWLSKASRNLPVGPNGFKNLSVGPNMRAFCR